MLSFRLSSRAIVSTVLLYLCASLQAQTIIHIPADRPTIQAGIDAAKNGDTVLIAPGTYYENINFKGKAITVTSSDGAARTVIDGGKQNAVVTFKAGEPRAAILSNLTITHGGSQNHSFYEDGNGVLITNSSPTLLNNVITQNYCQNISSYSSGPLIQGNIVSSSLNAKTCGALHNGGINLQGNLHSSSPISTDGVPPLVIGNTIENNETGQGAGGEGTGGAAVFISYGSPVIQGNIIRNNLAYTGKGGAIHVVSGDQISIIQNLIYGNSAGCGGGAFSDGGGIVSGETHVLVANNTIVNDTGDARPLTSDCAVSSEILTDGGGPSLKFVNNIIYATHGPAFNCGNYPYPFEDEAHQVLFDHNLFYDTEGAFFTSGCFDSSYLHGNIVADPQFVDPAAHDYHLRQTSPAIDAGNGSVLAMVKALSGFDLTKDFDGNPRELDATGKGKPIIDMGAYELTGTADAAPTRIVLSSSAYTGPTGSNFTLTATLSSALGVPTGSVIFYMDDQQIGVSTIAGGVATLNNVTYKPGAHVLYALYEGEGSYQAATSVIIVVNINQYRTTISLTSSANPSLIDQPVTIFVHVTSEDPDIIPSPILLDSYGSTLNTLVTPDSSGNASVSISTFSLGSHLIGAYFAGDYTHTADRTSFFQDVIDGYPTITTLLSSMNPSGGHQPVTFTAHVTSTTGTPTGSIQFTDGTNLIGDAVLDAAGYASLSTATLTIGTHTIHAVYAPASTHHSSSTVLMQQVNGLSTNAVLTATPTSILAGDTVTLSATVTDLTHTGTPTGTVTFYSGATVLGTSALNGSGEVTITSKNFYAGANSLTCTYSGDAVYSPANCAAVPLQVQGVDTVLTLVPNASPTPALTPVTFTARLTSRGQSISGSIRFSLDGQPFSVGMAGTDGIATLSLTLPTGSHTVTAEFAATSALNASSSSVTEVAKQNPTSTTLNVPQTAVYQNQPFSISASILALTGTAQPYGTVSLLEGTSLLSTATIAAGQNSSNISFSISAPAVGTHQLHAVYTPADNNFSGSTSLQVPLEVLAQTFTLTVDPEAISIQTEHHKSLTLTLTSIGGWTGPVHLSCVTPLPPVLTCEMPATVSLAAGQSATATLTLDTDVILGFKSSIEDSAVKPRRKATLFSGALAFMLPFVLFGVRGKRRPYPLLVITLALFAGFCSFTGCSTKYPDHTPPGDYQVVLNATGTSAGAVTPTTQTVQIALTITP